MDKGRNVMASESGNNRKVANALGADEVLAYLRANPDFLARNLELVDVLTPPKQYLGDSVADFQYFMVERLRSQARRLTEQHRDLIATTRANLHSQTRVHAAALFLLDAQSFEHLIQTIGTDLAVLLDLDVACLVVEASGRKCPRVHNPGVRVVESGTVTRMLGRKDTLLRCDVFGDPVVFGAGAGLVRSEALVRLHVSSAAPDGMLAFGSRDPGMFYQGQGTELILFLARVVERCIRSWLDLPP